MNDESTRYLDRLSVALTDAPAPLREEIVAGVREELVGLDAAQASARIAELGDPLQIAAEALDGLPAAAAPGPRSSPVYVGVTVALLVVGGYVLPVVGWLAGILLVVGSTAWTSREKKTAIAASVASAVVALALLFALRGGQAGEAGFVLFLVVPLVGNLVAGFYLGLKSRVTGGSARG